MTALLFGDGAAEALLSDQAFVAGLLKVEAELALAQADLGLIDAADAKAISDACLAIKIDMGALAEGMARDGVVVPALLAQVRRVLAKGPRPVAVDALHYGATSQDIVDTARMLRLKALVAHWDGQLGVVLARLGELAFRHADLPMAGRTYGQLAVPTSFGALVASWGRPLLRHRAALWQWSESDAQLSLSGAAGTLSVMANHGKALRAGLAKRLGLAVPEGDWHGERDGIVRLAAILAQIAGALARIGEDVTFMAASGIDELVLTGAGGSSTMPQKANPVAPAALVALARHAMTLAADLPAAQVFRRERDGASWLGEGLALDALCQAVSGALSLGARSVAAIEPVPGAMQANLASKGRTIHAEAITFALARKIGRSAASRDVARLCEVAIKGGKSLAQLVAEEYPDLNLDQALSAQNLLGLAPDEARAFAEQARQKAL